ncbi:hypothetical protein [Geothrix sp. PMB-07]|uniref:hypothetical protein n=1 Tax=Geothrix sp. PMB-07 TaxID=3068640 RepID=UPI0027410F59|nr:hypothetical protein [Geothrix sp. PMB-07]WLT31739.1 hypothetical protein Q9293_00110 [Geothrix sp. PMB-07]
MLFHIPGRPALFCIALVLGFKGLALRAQLPSDLPIQGAIQVQSDGARDLTLAADWVRADLRFPMGSRLFFRTDGHLDRCILGRDASFHGVIFPAGSQLAWDAHDHLTIAFLSRDCLIQGHTLKGHGHDWMPRFHPNGQLQLAWLAQDERIDGIPCARTRFWREFLRLRGWGGTSFHPTGRLASATLAADTTIQGKALPAGTRIQLDSDGRLLAP